MPVSSIALQRQLAASIVTVSGVLQVASLWRNRLSEDVLLTALVGSIYLLIALGLFGRSRFALFVAVATCGSSALLLGPDLPLAAWSSLQQLRIAGDAIVAMLCLHVLWSVRKLPSI
ncbi:MULTISPECIES: hypothetical protein [Haliea]|jgi:hypothetical protein|uniref:Uncharacterized protein n=1 Tax=Haliea salexigens TaxID=287487 RepID=A0A3C1KJ91_9GAMM|nr:MULTISPECIES: hypothetical protein [Haliea]HAN26543.1 hypothetical protein [Haliea salexigens]HCD56512.1 hypothetical protein [Halieaceae bacterium]MAA86976.1 hypothetical protein [Haliea sp.]MAD63285.1 hypothetical protein [Haliea sp.]MAY94217.1 hypothetical protein [Haliea sp.]|tara:strand:- start:1838 stop:2188 length:351 start_codon:yes stop_codon:yes gene_type:complete